MPAHSSNVRSKACVECRQQKLRCDAHLDPSNPCSRCRKTGADCIISDTFRRRPRKTKAQMQREIDNLRRQAEMQARHSTDLNENTQAIYLSSPSEQAAHEDAMVGSDTSRQRENIEDQTTLLQKGGATSRSIDGLELESYKIDDCFSLFFKHYFIILPIVDHRNDPNWFYEYSPLVFWTITAIGSRKYEQDPTILETLGPRVTALAMQSMLNRLENMKTIQSLLLLCMWPFPMDTMMTDVSLPMTGVAMQLALQNGLHSFGRRQDFTVQITQNEKQDLFRPRLWSHCRTVCQITSIVNGLQPSVVTDAFDLPPAQQQEALNILSPELFWAHKLQGTFTKAITALMANVYPVTNIPLCPLIDTWDNQVLEIVKEAGGYLERLLLRDHIAQDQLSVLFMRLHIGTFYFYDHDESARHSRLIALYHTACLFIEAVSSADKSHNYALYTPEFIYRSLNLAACVILRISWSNLREHVDLITGERAYFSCINILKRRMIRNNDLNGRTTGVLTQLWRSPQAFKQKDGSYNSLVVRIRSRGSMGIFFDCFWYWQREFNNQTDPYYDQSNTSQPAAATNVQESEGIPVPSTSDSGAMAPHLDPAMVTSDEQLFPFLNTEFFPDWDSMDGFQIPSFVAGPASIEH